MKKFKLLLFMLLTTASLMAQRTVTGTVTDAEGEALIGASVLVQGTSTGTVTDLSGKFSLNVPSDAKSLVISYTGYATQTIELGASNVIDVVMQEGGVDLDVVVVSATGLERNAREVVYANQTVKGEDLLSAPNKNALEALRGKTAGVKLSTASGSVGASTRIVLRGEGSLTGDNNALIVVDGIPIDNSTSSGGAGSSTSGYADHGNRFNDINPEDIESITVLKGPSATSLYGSRGASGVLLITTKKGAQGKKGKVDVGINSSYSRERAIILLDRQDQFGQGYDNLHFDSGENWAWGPAFDGVVRPWTSPVDTDGDGALESLIRPYSNVDNQLQEFFNLGQTLSNSVYLSGANEGFSYYASYSNTDQDGILDNTKYKRNTYSFNGTAKLSERLSSSFKVSYANTKQNTAQEGSRSFEGNNAYAMAIQSPVNIPFGELRDYNSPFHDIDGYWGSYNSVNPYFILNEYGNDGDINNFLGNASVTYNLLKGLDLVGRFGVNVVNTTIETFTPPYTPAEQLIWGDDLLLSTRNSKHSSLGDYTKFTGQTTNLDFSGFANFNKQLSDDFSFDGSVGYNFFQRERNNLTGATLGGLVVPGFYNLSNSAAAPLSAEYKELYRIIGALGNLRVGYQNALFLEYSARNDWSTTLPKENRSFFYQAVGASVVITDLLDVKNDVLSYGKLRASFGTSGKDAPVYLLNSTYVGNPDLVDLGDFTINFPLNGQSGFTTGDVIGNPDLKPELTTTFEVGADVGLFNDRINLAYTYYSSVHSDQIVRINLPRSTGFVNTVSNIGEMTNKGHELTLNLKPIAGMVSGLKWDLFFTYSKNKNEVTKVTDEIDELVVGGPFTPGVSIVAKEGLPFGTFKGLAPLTNDAGQTVVDPNTGFPLYTAEEQYLGNFQPDYLMNWGTSIEYKGIGFNILFDLKEGGNFASQTQFFTEFNGTSEGTVTYNREEYVYPNSVIDNGDGTYSENTVLITEQNYFTNYDPAASNYIQDASFIKLREIGVSYTLPKKFLNDMPISDVRIAFFGRNARFWLPSSNIYADPEVNGPALTGNASGIETSQTPPARSYGVNLSLKF
jgi:TonB-linked SusC/RagA family outer membrane protein